MALPWRWEGEHVCVFVLDNRRKAANDQFQVIRILAHLLFNFAFTREDHITQLWENNLRLGSGVQFRGAGWDN